MAVIIGGLTVKAMPSQPMSDSEIQAQVEFVSAFLGSMEGFEPLENEK